ncbi:delta-60 repeat domain-containing protein [Chryseobacterium binzhouense]|uniref:delta-60 repeat domain-containing protein n=1 Tax=Chryseobacterium binzhouense TaxID=2593646 RepID=UPI0035E3E641
MRLNYNGSNDSTFNIQGGPNTNLITCALQSDGKIVIGGNFTNYSGVSINRIARIIGGSSLSVAEQTKDDLKYIPIQQVELFKSLLKMSFRHILSILTMEE